MVGTQSYYTCGQGAAETHARSHRRPSCSRAAHAAGACRRRRGGHFEGVRRAPGRAAVAEGAGCPQGGDQGGCPGELAAARPAVERVPSAARVVTITQLPSLDPHARRPPAPVTGLAVVRRLATLADSLQLSTIGPGAPCPLAAGGGIRLTFLARAGGPPLAVAQGPAACGTVQFSVGGKRQPVLRITGGRRAGAQADLADDAGEPGEAGRVDLAPRASCRRPRGSVRRQRPRSRPSP
jgi:hypothetical protein